MKTLLNTQLLQEIACIVDSHIESLKCYGILGSVMLDSAANPVLDDIEALFTLLHFYPPEEASLEQYQDVYRTKQAIEAFLKAMNQDTNEAFSYTELGRIHAQAQRWCNVAKRNFRPPIEQIWDVIQPAVPDCLVEDDDGVFYTAKWWTPVPKMDIEILHRTNRIAIRDEFVDPKNPGLACVQFSLTPAAF